MSEATSTISLHTSRGKKAAQAKDPALGRETKTTRIVSTTTSAQETDTERTRLIAEAAYYRAEQRGFVGGDPVEDWLAAEAEVDTRNR